MANHKAPVPAWLDETYLEDIFKNYFHQPNLKIQKIEVTPGSVEGDNYACQILRIKIELKMENEKKELSIIGKLKVDTRLTGAADKLVDLFAVEAAFFDKLLSPVKEELQEIKSAKNYAPECYYVDYEHKLILMEDLKERNFDLQPRGKFLSKEQALLVMEALATMHGTLFKVDKKDPTLRESFRRTMWSSEPNVLIDQWFIAGVKHLDQNIDSFDLSDEWQHKIREFGKKLLKESLKVCDFKEHQLNVLRHGDPWMNNMMFHFTNGVADQVLLLDYQIVNYNSLVNDLHYFFFTSVDADVLVNDLNTLIETYYNQLEAVAPEIPGLSLERVKKEFRENQFFGCVMAVMFRPAMHSQAPIDIDLAMDGELAENSGFEQPGYKADLHKLLPLMDAAGVFQ